MKEPVIAVEMHAPWAQPNDPAKVVVFVFRMPQHGRDAYTVVQVQVRREGEPAFVACHKRKKWWHAEMHYNIVEHLRALDRSTTHTQQEA